MSKTAVITGASRGIGLAICHELLQEGYNIVGISRNMDFDSAIQDKARQLKLKLLPIHADISILEDHKRIYQAIHEAFGEIHVLVNNAGVAPEIRTDVLEMSMESYQRVMGINLEGPIFLTQSLFPLLRSSDQSYIVFITSISAVAASDNRAEYCVSKAGLSMFAKVLAKRLASEPCKVFEIRPGIINTDMIKPVKAQYDKLVKDGLVPNGRLGKPEDIAQAVKSLVSGGFDYAHGAILEISGGMQIRNL